MASWALSGFAAAALVACSANVPSNSMEGVPSAPSALQQSGQPGNALLIETGKYAGRWIAAELNGSDELARLVSADTKQRLSVQPSANSATIWVREGWLKQRRVSAAVFGLQLDSSADQSGILEKAAEFISALGGGTLVIGEGTIWVNGKGAGRALALDDISNVIFETAGAGKTIFKLASAGGYKQVRVITLARSSNIVFTGGFSVDGNFSALQKGASTLGPEQMGGIFMVDNKGVRIEDVFVYNVGGDAIRLGGSEGGSDTNIMLVRPKWENTGRNGITLGGYGFQNIVIDTPYGGEGVDTQQIDFEPRGSGTFANITITDPMLKSTGRDKDDYAIVISGKREITGISHATNVSVTGGDIQGTILIRNGKGIKIERNSRIISDNPFRRGAVEIDFASEDVLIANNSMIRKDNGFSGGRAGTIYVRQAGGLAPGLVTVRHNTLAGSAAAVIVNGGRKIGIFDNKVSSSDYSGSLIELRSSQSQSLSAQIDGNDFDSNRKSAPVSLDGPSMRSSNVSMTGNKVGGRAQNTGLLETGR